jgi:hypothetical protein
MPERIFDHMISSIRTQYNEAFSTEKYQAFLRDLDEGHPGAIAFRIAETPVFIPTTFLHQLTEACSDILRVIQQPDFKKHTDGAIPKRLEVPGETDHPEFMVFDFAISTDGKGGLIPQLVELQGCPGINVFQQRLARGYRHHFHIPDDFSHYLSGYDDPKYKVLLREIIVGDHDPGEVILLDVRPDQQKTRIDFYLTKDELGIASVGITELQREGRKLFYYRQGKKTRVRRIYNRLSFDDLLARKRTLGKSLDLTRRMDVQWAPHPNWFYRVGKYTLPLLSSKYVPPAYYLNKLAVLPADMENYVLKPLFSHAGQGVLLDVKKTVIEKLKNPQDWILQRKVDYASAIQTPEGPAKCGISLMFFWKDGAETPTLVQNLCRLSKGTMPGGRYHANRKWAGTSICFFEQ